MSSEISQTVATEWVTFPGGELEGRRPKVMCLACRERLSGILSHPTGPSGRSRHSNPSRPLCFQCYRAELDRERALKAAGELDTASDERFQSLLPFEPVNRARLEMLKADRAASRTSLTEGVGRFTDRRRQAQIEARHALQRIAAGLGTRMIPASALHAAELQLPESWLPFVMSR